MLSTRYTVVTRRAISAAISLTNRPFFNPEGSCRAKRLDARDTVGASGTAQLACDVLRLLRAEEAIHASGAGSVSPVAVRLLSAHGQTIRCGVNFKSGRHWGTVAIAFL